MPTHSLKKLSLQADPWDEFLITLGALPAGKRIFNQFQRATMGFVVARWKDETSSSPTHYLWEYTRSLTSPPSIVRYSGTWKKFGDETISENPKQYRSLRLAKEIVEELRHTLETKRIGLAFWTHPESKYKPADMHQLMDGFRLPGSPQQ